MLISAQTFEIESNLSKSNSSGSQDTKGFCVSIPDFMTARECEELLIESKYFGYVSAATEYPLSYRNNDRQVRDDTDLAQKLFQRLYESAPKILCDERGDRWQLDSLNEKFRLCRYQAGQRFNVHQDGTHYRGKKLCSRLTFLLYLNGADEFEGGDTVFYSAGPWAAAGTGSACETARIKPATGTLVMFDHALWHAGESVAGGAKYIIRSDLMYRKIDDAASSDPNRRDSFDEGHEGYIWTMARLDKDCFASGGRDGSIRIWSPDDSLLKKLDGHQQSVLGLSQMDSNLLASVSRDRSLKLWDLQTGTCVASTVAHDSAVLNVLALQGGMLVTGGADGIVKLWSRRLDVLGELKGHTGWVWSIADLGNGCIASVSEDATIKVWDVRKQLIIDAVSFDAPLHSVCFVQETGALLVGTVDGTVQHLRFEDFHLTKVTYHQSHNAAVRRIRYVGDGMVVTSGEDKWTRLWNYSEWALVAELEHHNFATDALRIDEKILSCSYDGTIRPLNYNFALINLATD